MSFEQNLAHSHAAVVVEYDLPHTEEHQDATTNKNRQDAASSHHPTDEPHPTVIAPSRVVVADHLFSLTAAVIAAVYGIAFLGTLFWRVYTWDSELLAVTWNVRDNPQTVIAICLVFAASFLWLWRGAVGKVLASLSYGFILWQFYQWYEATKQVKTNIGIDSIPYAERFDNSMLGAGWLDVIMLPVVITLLGLSVYFLKPYISVAPSAQGATGDTAVNGSLQRAPRM